MRYNKGIDLFIFSSTCVSIVRVRAIPNFCRSRGKRHLTRLLFPVEFSREDKFRTRSTLRSELWELKLTGEQKGAHNWNARYYLYLSYFSRPCFDSKFQLMKSKIAYISPMHQNGHIAVIHQIKSFRFK